VRPFSRPRISLYPAFRFACASESPTIRVCTLDDWYGEGSISRQEFVSDLSPEFLAAKEPEREHNGNQRGNTPALLFYPRFLFLTGNIFFSSSLPTIQTTGQTTASCANSFSRRIEADIHHHHIQS